MRNGQRRRNHLTESGLAPPTRGRTVNSHSEPVRTDHRNESGRGEPMRRRVVRAHRQRRPHPRPPRRRSHPPRPHPPTQPPTHLTQTWASPSPCGRWREAHLPRLDRGRLGQSCSWSVSLSRRLAPGGRRPPHGDGQEAKRRTSGRSSSRSARGRCTSVLVACYAAAPRFALAAAWAAPTMPARFNMWAGTSGVGTSIMSKYLSWCRLTPPPMMNNSGLNRRSR
jgi:hypothetical protein